MSIINRVLTKLADREDLGAGKKRWRVEGVDTEHGCLWVFGPFTATQVEAEAIRDSCWTQEQIDLHNEDFMQGRGKSRSRGR